MTTRVLDPSEWESKLAGTELEAAVPYLPRGTEVLVVERWDGTVAACWALIYYLHVEGCWIEPEGRRKLAVARRLLSFMRERARARGATAVLTAATDSKVAQLIRRLGGQLLPGEPYVLPIPQHGSNEVNPCQQPSRSP